MPIFPVIVTENEYDLGVHYDKAEALAEEAGYEGPFISFDDVEQSVVLSVARELDLVPCVVAVDFTEGQVRSVRCDAGDVKVICYDTSDTDILSDAVVALPVGKDGISVRCWAHSQTADVDPSLKKARS